MTVAGRRRWPKLLLAAVVGALFFEGGLRLMLTAPWIADSAWAREVGAPARFAWPSQDLYWRFVHRLQTSEAATFEAPHDPALGWTWPRIEPGTYAHDEEARLAGRRPVLLFGDSYSACLTAREECFEGLLERTLLIGRCQLLNYGVCGYGFDQTCLLARAAVARHAGRDPAVVIGLLVDDDLTRSLLSLREYPKPRLRVADGRTVVTGTPVPTRADYLADPEPLPLCWAWTWLRHAFGEDPLDDPDGEPRREVEQLTRTLLRELVADLRARELDFFFLLFHTASSFPAPAPGDWRTPLLCDALDELSAPWYDVREEFARRLAQDGGTIGDFYIPLDEPGGGHYDADGNAAAFAVLLRGLDERCDLRPTVQDLPQPSAFLGEVGEGGGLATFSKGSAAPFDIVPSEARLILRASRGSPSSATYTLDGLARRFRARVWVYDPDGAAAEFEFAALVDGRPAWQGRLRSGDPPQALELDLRDVRTLRLSLAVHASRGCLILADPEIE